MDCQNPACGREIMKDQFCIETPDQFRKRLESQYCRPKCKRLSAPTRPERVTGTLDIDPTIWPIMPMRPELKAQEKETTPRDEGFREFTRTFDCTDCGWPAHMGHMENHHIRTGGTSIKCSDYETVNLCGPEARGCHLKADKSPDSYQKYLPAALMLQALWVKAGHRIKKGR